MNVDLKTTALSKKKNTLFQQTLNLDIIVEVLAKTFMDK